MIINLTPHAITIVTGTGGFDGAMPAVTYPPSGVVARVATRREVGPTVEGLPTWLTTFGEVTDLPAPREGVTLVVSALVQGHPAVRGREDVFSPGEAVRDAGGNIVGARGLSRAV